MNERSPLPLLADLTPLPASFYDRDTTLVARELIGATLVRVVDGVRRIGRIVEAEAYVGEADRACHSSRGRTARTETMFGPPGHAYVYLIYGMYCCLNAVTRPPGCAEAVLLRAVEPIEGFSARADGPGRLCRALDIDRRLNGASLQGPDLLIAAPLSAPRRVARTPRIGVDYAGPWARRLLRFHEIGNPHVSRTKS